MIKDVESHFCGESAWSCNYCSTLVLADEDQMQDHLEVCIKFQETLKK